MARPLPLNARHGRLELQARLLQLGVRLPVIGVTGQGDVQSAVRAMNASAVDFIEKPYNDDVLLSVTKAALEKTGCPDRDREAEEAAERIGMLSPREREVLDALLAGGQSFLVELGASHTVEAPRYLLRDGDRVYGAAVMHRLRTMGIRDKPIARARLGRTASPKG
jgi:FixJ family two-component response regulator